MRGDGLARLGWAGVALGLALLILQGAITIPARMAEGGGPLRALVFFFSYLGIVVLAGQTLVWFAAVSGRRRLRGLSGPTARAMMAGAGVALMLVHMPLLSPATAAPGFAGLVDLGVHYLVPLLFLVWWLLGPHPVRLRWGRVGVMLALPIGYAVWVLVRGALIGRWPYPFTAVPDLGWTRVILNLAGLTLAFGLVFLAVVAASRVLHSRARFGLTAR